MSQPILCERTFAWDRQRWRVDSNGNWTTWMWGWWPDSHGTPSGRFMPIEKEKVPRELLAMVDR